MFALLSDMDAAWLIRLEVLRAGGVCSAAQLAVTCRAEYAGRVVGPTRGLAGERGRIELATDAAAHGFIDLYLALRGRQAGGARPVDIVAAIRNNRGAFFDQFVTYALGPEGCTELVAAIESRSARMFERVWAWYMRGMCSVSIFSLYTTYYAAIIDALARHGRRHAIAAFLHECPMSQGTLDGLTALACRYANLKLLKWLWRNTHCDTNNTTLFRNAIKSGSIATLDFVYAQFTPHTDAAATQFKKHVIGTGAQFGQLVASTGSPALLAWLDAHGFAVTFPPCKFVLSSAVMTGRVAWVEQLVARGAVLTSDCWGSLGCIGDAGQRTAMARYLLDQQCPGLVLQ